jgi:hypothetical protein
MRSVDAPVCPLVGRVLNTPPLAAFACLLPSLRNDRNPPLDAMYPDDNYEPSGKVLPRILTSSGKGGRGRGGNTSDEMEAQLQATVRVWQTLQQQIQRGEDHYVEESGSFNIYKGWDGFIDARLFETMPKRFDHRWFSSSVSHTLSHQVNTLS